MNVTEVVGTKLKQVYPTLNDEQQRVLYAIWQAWAAKQKITQRDIARCALGLGHHEEHEAHLPHKKGESTLRKVRQIIRDLRVTHKIPILSDKNGYWLPYSFEECREYLERIEGVARAQSAAWFETYRAMEDTVGVRSAFFDKQKTLQL